MSNRRIKASLGRTISLDRYEFLRIDLGLEEDIHDSISVIEELNKAFDQLEKYLGIKSTEFENKLTNKVTQEHFENHPTTTDNSSRRRRRNK